MKYTECELSALYLNQLLCLERNRENLIDGSELLTTCRCEDGSLDFLLQVRGPDLTIISLDGNLRPFTIDLDYTLNIRKYIEEKRLDGGE